jgi:hypothetical protein
MSYSYTGIPFDSLKTDSSSSSGGLDPLACFYFRTNLKTTNLTGSWQDSLDGGSVSRKATTYTRQHKHTRMQIYIHASSGIQTPDPSARMDEDISCLRQYGNCDRLIKYKTQIRNTQRFHS